MKLCTPNPNVKVSVYMGPAQADATSPAVGKREKDTGKILSNVGKRQEN